MLPKYTLLKLQLVNDAAQMVNNTDDDYIWEVLMGSGNNLNGQVGCIHQILQISEMLKLHQMHPF